MLLVDDRVGSKDLAAPLNRYTEVRLTRLDAGDVAFAGNGPDGLWFVGIEVKTVHDFLNGVFTGRLGFQLTMMETHYNFGYLILEGLIRPSKDGKLEIYRGGSWRLLTIGSITVTVSELMKMANTVAVCSGTPVWFTKTRADTVGLIATLHAWWQEPWDSHTSDKPKPRTGIFRRAPLVRRVAAELPGIGWQRSKVVAEHFRTVYNMVNAPTDEWTKIRGIGKKTATNVVEAMRKEEAHEV